MQKSNQHELIFGRMLVDLDLLAKWVAPPTGEARPGGFSNNRPAYLEERRVELSSESANVCPWQQTGAQIKPLAHLIFPLSSSSFARSPATSKGQPANQPLWIVAIDRRSLGRSRGFAAGWTGGVDCAEFASSAGRNWIGQVGRAASFEFSLPESSEAAN